LFRIAGILTWLSIAATVLGQSRPVADTGSTPSLVPAVASLQIKGKVTVNQRLIGEASSVIADGDRVETGPFAAARISDRGVSLYLPENSCLEYGGQQFEICNCGSAEVSARKPVSLMFKDRDLVVSPEGPSTTFAVSVTGNDLDLVNQAGIVKVVSNGGTLTQVNSHSSHSLAGFGCRTPINHFSSAAGAAAAIAAPAVVAGVVISRSTNRQPVSSLAP